MTNVPAPTWTPNGFVIPSDDAILTGVQADQNAAFGGDLNPALETPQGQLATSQTAIISNADQTFLFYTTQTDPAFAIGRMQDAIGRIYFIERIPAEPTLVTATCTGLAGTVIPPGSLAQAGDGNTYTCTDGGAIPVGGSIFLTFACNTVGPIACPANTLNVIARAIPGWDTINNPSDGVLGRNTEGRAAFEARRAASVALNSRGALPSVRGAVLSVAGVLDAYVTENVTGSPVTIGDFTLAAHSLYVAVVGGTDANVANAIWSKKAPGCAYNGNTTVTVQDTNSGYTPPYPSYSVSFERPAALTVLFAITIANSSLVPSNATDLIQSAIIGAFAGADGGSRAQIGSTLYASRYYATIAALGPWVQIVSILIGSNNAASAKFTASISGTNMTVSAVASGTLAANQIVSGTGVTEGTTIVSQSSGSPGSTGVYVISPSETVGSTAMVSAIPNLTTVTVGIDQVPVTAAPDIIVTAV